MWDTQRGVCFWWVVIDMPWRWPVASGPSRLGAKLLLLPLLLRNSMTWTVWPAPSATASTLISFFCISIRPSPQIATLPHYCYCFCNFYCFYVLTCNCILIMIPSAEVNRSGKWRQKRIFKISPWNVLHCIWFRYADYYQTIFLTATTLKK